MPQDGATFVLELGQGKFEWHSFFARLTNSPISTVIVDVHLYEIFRITDFIAAL